MFAKLASTVPLALAAALAAGAAAAAPILTNGGFEDGFGPVTVDIWTNPLTPNGWTPNFAFAAGTAHNRQQTDNSVAHSGTGSLAIGNGDNSSGAVLSQSFSDIVGHTYIVDFWGAWDPQENVPDPVGLMRVTVGAGSIELHESGSVLAYAHHSFSFIGAGSDTLDILAATDLGQWRIDDISVTDNGGPGGVNGGVPEPAGWAMMILGFGAVGGLLRRRRLHFAPG